VCSSDLEEMSRTMMEMCDWSPFPTGRA